MPVLFYMLFYLPILSVPTMSDIFESSWSAIRCLLKLIVHNVSCLTQTYIGYRRVKVIIHIFRVGVNLITHELHYLFHPSREKYFQIYSTIAVQYSLYY